MLNKPVFNVGLMSKEFSKSADTQGEFRALKKLNVSLDLNYKQHTELIS